MAIIKVKDYRFHGIHMNDRNGNYIVRVQEGRFTGCEIAYKTSIEACEEFIDGLSTSKDCDTCHGTGYIKGSMGMTQGQFQCPDCKGTGHSKYFIKNDEQYKQMSMHDNCDKLICLARRAEKVINMLDCTFCQKKIDTGTDSYMRWIKNPDDVFVCEECALKIMEFFKDLIKNG